MKEGGDNIISLKGKAKDNFIDDGSTDGFLKEERVKS